ncbi:MAG: hypothetical protein Q8L85_03595 [Alphaproteobacteria bacterium]|nr:hypothetical protein [Alphaproteobacteria bacterium]
MKKIVLIAFGIFINISSLYAGRNEVYNNLKISFNAECDAWDNEFQAWEDEIKAWDELSNISSVYLFDMPSEILDMPSKILNTPSRNFNAPSQWENEKEYKIKLKKWRVEREKFQAKREIFQGKRKIHELTHLLNNLYLKKDAFLMNNSGSLKNNNFSLRVDKGTYNNLKIAFDVEREAWDNEFQAWEDEIKAWDELSKNSSMGFSFDRPRRIGDMPSKIGSKGPGSLDAPSRICPDVVEYEAKLDKWCVERNKLKAKREKFQNKRELYEFDAKNTLIFNTLDKIGNPLNTAQQKEILEGELHRLSYSRAGSDVLPDDFNPIVYLGLYSDLQIVYGQLPLDAKMDKVTEHYLTHGMKEPENRKYKPDPLPVGFDPLVYIDIYQDLKLAYGHLPLEVKKAEVAKHYLMHGKKEGRRYL